VRFFATSKKPPELFDALAQLFKVCAQLFYGYCLYHFLSSPS
jgi:hypothetical protein